jgi:hypothetical protein
MCTFKLPQKPLSLLLFCVCSDHTQMGRDVFNEKPSTEELLAVDAAGGGASLLPRGAVLHTTKVRGGPDPKH